MKLQDALRLHNEDEVIIKETGKAVFVIETETVEVPEGTFVSVYCSDGNWYGHKKIK